jgi:hypothetical protein
LIITQPYRLLIIQARYHDTTARQPGSQYANALQGSLGHYTKALQFTGDFFNYSSEVTRADFAGFAKTTIARYPGIHAFSWNPLVFDDQRLYYENKAQAEGLPTLYSPAKIPLAN